MKLNASVFSIALLAFGLQVGAAPIILDFESSPGPDGLIATADDIPTPLPCIACRPLSALGYGALGVNFTSGTLFADPLFPTHGPNNHFSSSTVPDATFSVPVYRISLSSFSVWSLTLYAFDATGAILATATFTNSTGSLTLARLEVNSATPIARFTVRPEGCLPSEPSCGRILNIDDMAFDTQPTASPAVGVPTLNDGMLAMLAALILWVAWHRRLKTRPSRPG